MKVVAYNRTKRIYLAVSLLAVAIVATFLLSSLFNRPPVNNTNPNNVTELLIIEDVEQQPSNQPVNNVICTDREATTDAFTLTSPANVYTTALNAKNKTNPTAIYQPGEYFVFSCSDDMANITQTQGRPGGWIDPNNPYSEPTPAPGETPRPNPVINVMTLNNTIVNWSHEYPTAFVSEYNGLWNISPNNLYLTFDSGYDYNNLSSSILDTLSLKGVKAVFFVTGDFMNDRPDLIQRMINDGHIVGNHSYSHLNQPQNLEVAVDDVVNDIRAWEQRYRDIMGANPSTLYFRPPAGAISRRSIALMNQLGYRTLMWGSAYKDWDTSAQPTQELAMELLRQYTTPGDIILLHGISQTSNDILGQFIDEYREKGFNFSLP